MDDTQQLLGELNEWVWSQLRNDLAGVDSQEVDWRPVAQANTINAIVRHLRIEAEWQLASLEQGEPMPAETTVALQTFIDTIPLDFAQNLGELEAQSAIYCTTRGMSACFLPDSPTFSRPTAVGRSKPAARAGTIHSRLAGDPRRSPAAP